MNKKAIAMTFFFFKGEKMVKIKLFLAALLLLSFTSLFAQPLEPLLMSPPDMAPGVPAEGTILMWMQPDHQPSYLYEIYLDFDEFFPNPPVYLGPAMEFYLGDHFEFPAPPLFPGPLYCWKIRVTDTMSMLSMDSMTWHFIAGFGLQPDPPLLLTPPNDYNHADTGGLFLECMAGGGGLPDGFMFFFGENPPVLPLVQDSPGNVCHTGPLLPGTRYYWYVEAYNAYGSAVSDIWSFQTAGDLVPPPPELVYPADDDDNVPSDNLDACWNEDAPTGLVSYWSFYMDTDPGFPNPPLYSGPLDPDDRNRSPYHLSVGPLIPEQLYYWFVRAHYHIDDIPHFVDSEVFSFSTGASVIATSSISGTVVPGNPLFNVGGVTVSCPGACVPATVTTQDNGNYSFTVNNSGTYVVSSVKSGYCFNPASASFSNVQNNQTANFTMLSLYPNGATQPVPAHLATGVSIQIGQLQWTYLPEPGYSLPTAFEVYFPADDPDPVIIDYPSRDSLFTLSIPELEYMSPYDWRVIPRNDIGWYVDSIVWEFTTEDSLRPPSLLSPPYFADAFESGSVSSWEMLPIGERLQPPYLFEVYMDTDPAFPNPPNYIGDGHPDEASPGYFWSRSSGLAYNEHYYWKVVAYLNEQLAESEVWEFDTLEAPTPPVLIFPPDLETGVPVQDMNLEWDLVNWQIDSFFDVFCDIDPSFPNPPVYSGNLTPSRYHFIYNLPALMQEQTYYWYVRYTNQTEGWSVSSLVSQFSTGNFAIPFSTISGVISSTHNVSSCTVTCPQACVPAMLSTGIAGTFSFCVNNGLNPVVTPAKQGYWFSPGFYQFNNIQSNQTANFSMISLLPNLPIQPIPVDLTANVSINWNVLQWTYIPSDYHTQPLAFHGTYYILPGREILYEETIPYTGPGDYVMTLPPSLLPMEYDTTYFWEIVPYNADGEAEGTAPWSFTTEGSLLQPPVYIYPCNHDSGIGDAGLIMAWDPPPDGDYPAESFFDVYCDIDPLFPDPPFFSGPIPPPDPMNPGRRYVYVPDLDLGTLYYWKVVVTDPIAELVTPGPTWDFITTTGHVEYPVPELILPLAGETNVGPRGVDFHWDYDWTPDSFFDVFCDIDPGFPGPPIYSGSGVPLDTILSYHQATLLAEQPYHWFVRYSNFVDFWYAKSPIQLFTTGVPIPPPPPELLEPPDLALVTPPSVDLEWSCDPDWWVESFFDVFCDIDPGFPQAPVYSGSGQELLNEGIFSFNQTGLLDEQTYYWYVRITDIISEFSSSSPVRQFSTAQPNPLVLVYPPDSEMGLPAEEIILQFDYALWQPDSFFDIFVDLDPEFPEEPIYSGPLIPVAGTLLHHEIGPLMAEQLFYWKVRVTQGDYQWTSAVRSFGTGAYVIPTHSVSGILFNQNGNGTGNRKITYYANNVYMGCVNSSPNPPYGSYTIHLPDHATTAYKVVPVKPTYIQYWSPSFMTYTNLTSNQTGQDYYLNSFTPSPVTQPLPNNFATGVSINVGQLQWTYLQQPAYGEPDGFEVYFPAGSPEPYAVVPYSRDPEYTVDIPPWNTTLITLGK